MAKIDGIWTPVEDGKVQDSSAAGNSPSAKRKDGSTLDKEAFLQLLVAQMKYQDPLEPTSNTEYISQLATFSSLEEMQNLNATMTDLEGASLVGKQVVMKVTSEATGATSRVTGFVEYVTRENGKTYLVIEGTPYHIEDLESVIDDKYLEAVAVAEAFKAAMDAMPSVRDVTLDYKDKIYAARDAVNAMTSYQQGFLDAGALAKLRDLLMRIAELEASIEKPEDDGSEDAEGTGGVEGSEGTEGEGTEGSAGEAGGDVGADAP